MTQSFNALTGALTLIVAFSTVSAAPKTKKAADLGDVRLLHKIVSEIAKEAIASWKDKKAWPRSTSNFAADHPHKLDQKTLRTGLTHRMHPHAAVDGYIKYQLLSYGLDTSSLSPSEVGKLIGGMPQIISQPSGAVKPAASGSSASSGFGGRGYFFSGRQTTFVSDLTPIPGAIGFDPTLSVVNSGVVLDVEAVVQRNGTITATVRGANANLQQLRGIIQQLNGPGMGYRDQLLDMIPHERGLKVAGRMTDVQHRVLAAEPSYQEAFDKLAKAGRDLQSIPNVPQAVRRQLVVDARKLNKAYTMVLDRYESRAGQIVPVKLPVRLDQGQLIAMMQDLRP